MEGQIQLSTNATSLDFLQAIYRDPNQPVQRRMRAAAAALPFEHPKLAVIARVREEDLAERLMRALAESGKVINGRATMQVIEGPKASRLLKRRLMSLTPTTPVPSLRTPSLASAG